LSQRSAASCLKPLERFGLRVLRRGSAATADDAVHVLNERERAALRAVEVRTLGWAVLMGVASAALAGAAEVAALPLLGPLPDAAGDAERLAFWIHYAPTLAVVSVVEIVALFANSLVGVRGQARAAGLPLDGEAGAAAALALTRAALELPNPIESEMEVNPQREVSRVRLLVASLVYKGKVALSTFVFKQVVQRLLGRAATRYLLAFAAVPVNAVWNGVTTWLVLREGRVRVMGPSAAAEMLAAVLAAYPDPGPDARAACFKAVGSAVVRTRDLHPNHVVMLRLLGHHLGPPPPGRELDSPGRFLALLAGLPPEERRLAVRCLSIGSVIDGRLVPRERALLREARCAAGLDDDLTATRALLRDFLSGRSIPAADVLATA
jgi:hypothetical protein